MTAMTVATISHIVIDDKGVARIAGSRSRVIDIVLDTQAYQLTPAQIHQEHPHLSLAQIYAALSYYHDHKVELDADIERRFQAAEEMRKKAGEPPLVKRLRAEGKLK
jgi:uncharacterized protein (DUF433 family)